MLRTNLQLYFKAVGLSQTMSAFFVGSRYKCQHENREFLANFGSLVMIRGLVWRLQNFRLSLLDGVISLMTGRLAWRKGFDQNWQGSGQRRRPFRVTLTRAGEPDTLSVGEGIGKSLEFLQSMGLCQLTLLCPSRPPWVMALGHGLGLYSFSFAIRISYLLQVES